MARADADIYAFQEIRTTEPIEHMVFNGYDAYWNCCTEKKGYSGTLVLTRIPVSSVSFDLGDDGEIEGRIITAEYEAFYLVNVYMPNTVRSRYRGDFRHDWDARLLRYLDELDARKPVVLCGDMNGTLSRLDVYDGNAQADKDEAGYMPS